MNIAALFVATRTFRQGRGSEPPSWILAAVLTSVVMGCLFLLCNCAPAPWEQHYGYYLDRSPSYSINPVASPGGVRYDNEVGDLLDVQQLDFLTDGLETCLERSIDRSSFVVKIPADWTYSCDGTEEVLPFKTPDRYCKGEAATEACPCRYRAVLQEPNVVVVTPNLKLYRDALTRLLTGSSNPWSDPNLSGCL